MLSPDHRATLLDALRPEPDEHLDAAVATTFTLDLVAALFPPLAFASFALRDPTDPVTALEAVRGCNRRVDVFCQAGQIAVPTDVADLMAFLEPMIHEVRQPRPGHLFHPKIWFLRYVSDQGLRYRFLCLTRNLTDDHSWDALLRLDGELTSAPAPANAPLSDLIRALPSMSVRPLPAGRAERIAGLADEVRRVEWDRPDGVDEIAFHAYGVAGKGTPRKGTPGSGPGADFRGNRHLVISPFCTEGGIRTVTADSTQRLVVSRSEQLDRLPLATLASLSSYVLSGTAGLPRSDSDSDGGILGGLHAKVYVVERATSAHLFVGSANATEAAFGGNVEILVELVGKPKHLGVEAILGPEIGDDDLKHEQTLRDLVERYEPTGDAPADHDEDEAWRLEQALRMVAQSVFTATVTADATGYAVAVTSDSTLDVPNDARFSIELLTRVGEARWQQHGAVATAMFGGLPLTEVTPFLVLRASTAGGHSYATVVQAVLIGDPIGRHDEILARQIDTTEKFLRFVAALLGLTAGPGALLGVPGLSLGQGSTGWGTTGLFELLVRALGDRPEAMATLDSLVERLRATEHGAGVLPAGFTALWQTVVGALGLLGKQPGREPGLQRTAAGAS